MPSAIVVGNISFTNRIIKVAKRSGKPLRRRGLQARKTTFWHEVVHGILYDMGSRKNSDEIFVHGIATRLAQVVKSARFDGGDDL
jgi:hypothetical protein